MTLPYLGAKISLTSNCLFRYEGILSAVDPVEATITLEQVKLFGTEGRKPGQEVPASDQVYELVVFRSGDIKDLEIYEKEIPAVVESSPFIDPAIVQHASSTLKFGSHDPKTSSSSSSAASAAPAITKSSSSLPPAPKPSSKIVDDSLKNKEENSTSFKPVIRGRNVVSEEIKRPSSYASAVISDGPGRFRNVATADATNSNTSTVLKEKEYKFSSSGLKRPDDLQVKPSDGQESFYDKNTSFFDNISSQIVAEAISIKEGGDVSRQHHYHGHHQASTEYKNERQMNMDTFGMAFPPEQPYHQSFRGRGGYRGGRGGYRGGRGSSSSSSSNSFNSGSKTQN